MMYDGPLDGGATDREYVRWLVPSWGTAAEIGVGDDWSRGTARHYEPRPLVTGSFGWPAWADPLQGGAELNAWRSKERPKLDLFSGTLTGDDPDRWRRPPTLTRRLPTLTRPPTREEHNRQQERIRRKWDAAHWPTPPPPKLPLLPEYHNTWGVPVDGPRRGKPGRMSYAPTVRHEITGWGVVVGVPVITALVAWWVS